MFCRNSKSIYESPLVLARSAAMITQEWPLASVAMCISTFVMSVLPEAEPVVQPQLLGSSVHFNPPLKVLSPPLMYMSVKWKVVAWFTGVPLTSSTAPPLAAGPGNQSPTPTVGVLACRFPSMANPPLGTRTGATPVGGGFASSFSSDDNSRLKRQPTQRGRS